MSNNNDEELCLNCVRMNPVNGYCGKQGAYVNAFWSCKKFERPEDNATTNDEHAPRAPRVSHKKGVCPTAGRTEKRCSRCGRLKPIDDFVKLKRSADVHGCYCHECNTIRHREYKARKALKEQTQNKPNK